MHLPPSLGVILVANSTHSSVSRLQATVDVTSGTGTLLHLFLQTCKTWVWTDVYKLAGGELV